MNPDHLSIKCTPIYGHKEIVTFNKVINGVICAYGYSIDFDENNIEKSRTKPSLIAKLRID